MVTIAPFKALRPQPQFAQQVASRPYDVLNSREAKAEAAGNPDSFLHITKSEIDLPDDINIHAAIVYEKAKENLQDFCNRAVLFEEDKPCLYIYRLIMNGRSQTGLVCVSSLQDYENGLIKKHELTRPEKEEDRINHMKTIEAQTGNVFLAYVANEEVDSIIAQWTQQRPAVYDFTADDGIQHTVWVIHDAGVIQHITELFAGKIAATYIADGHHRAASAAKVDKLGNRPEAGFFLTTLFPSSQLHIMDYNRVVHDLNGLSEAAFLEAVQKDFMLQKLDSAFSPSYLHEFGMYLNGTWYRLFAKEGTYFNDPIGILDVTILQNNILDKILGIRDPRTDKRVDFVGGIRGLKELEERVNSGVAAAAFSLYPVSIRQLFDISDSNNIMPPKSTWFEPKLRDGLFTHLIG